MEITNQLKDNPEQSSYTRLEWVQFGLFWSWNLVFVAFMLLGFAPVLLPETFIAVRSGSIPVAYLIYALVLALIPVACLVLGVTVFRRAPARLFALGYVIEGPLMLILAVRFFAIRQATPGVFFTFAIALLGMAAFLWTLLDRRSGERTHLLEGLRLAGLTLMAITSLYASAWLAFYALPLAVEGWRALVSFFSEMPDRLRDAVIGLREMLIYNPMMLPFSILGFILVLYTATLLLLTPIVVPVLSLRTWWRSLSGQAGRLGWLRPAILVSVVLISSAGLFIFANRQPQKQAFALLAQTPSSEAEANALLEHSESIRAGLLNSYLAPYRYISAQGEVRHVRDLYESTFKIPRREAYAVQRLYEGLASPLLYKPVHPQEISSLQDNRALVEEPIEAARLYQRFFDEPINDAERETIVNAVRSTWSSGQAEAAWQVVDDREVYLVSQDVALQELGDWADLELHEVYQNQTSDLQEVIYYFNLPESAVITGVWLGDSADKAQANPFQVAPRGAAQAVYREQTRVSMDPALVEQIGPRQYRLRVYPIPRLVMEYDQETARTMVEDAPQLHMWLTWREMATTAGWPLPRLAEKLNVYWDNQTNRLLNGQENEQYQDEWLPETIPASGSITSQAHQVDLPDGQTVLALPENQVTIPSVPDPLRLAVVIDRSRSMQAHTEQMKKALEQLQAYNSSETPVDVYLTASPYRGEAPASLNLPDLGNANILYFGGQNPTEMLSQFETLRGDRQYDAIFVLTDGSGYELGESEVKIGVPPAPLWMVHLDGDLSLGYDDQTLQAIQASGGGIAGDIDTALQRLAVSLAASAQSTDQSFAASDILDNYLWISLPTDQVDTTLSDETAQIHDPQDGFAALAARRLILSEMQRNKGTIDQLETLDNLHALAIRYGIVTPYSSMIVLVNDQQKDLLADLSGMKDRYEREVETLGETAPASPVPLAGVPEPHEWLLMGLAAAILIYFVYTKRRPAPVNVT